MRQELNAAQMTRELVSLGVEHEDRILEIVREVGVKAFLTATKGMMEVRRGSNPALFTLCTPEKVAGTRPGGYTGPGKKASKPTKSASTKPRSSTMAKATVTETEDETTEKDYTQYAGKEATPTMTDFADWLIEVGAAGEFSSKAAEAAFRDGVRLGGTLRMDFQGSVFNKDRRAERQAARASDTSDTEPAGTETKTPAKRGRPAGAAKATGAKAGTTAPKRGRGRQATAEAPY
jgi:hypothetical protein